MSQKFTALTIASVQTALTAFYADPQNAHLLRPYCPPVIPLLPYPWGSAPSTPSSQHPTSIPLPHVTVNQVLEALSHDGLSDADVASYTSHDAKFLAQVIAGILHTLRAELSTLNPADLPNLGW